MKILDWFKKPKMTVEEIMRIPEPHEAVPCDNPEGHKFEHKEFRAGRGLQCKYCCAAVVF